MRLAYRFTRDPDAALDAAQQAWVYLLGRLPTLRLRTGRGDTRFTTFLYPVVRSCAATAWRRRRLAPAAAPPAAAPAAPAAPHAALRDAVDALPAPQREVLLMRVVHEMSTREIAAALRIPEGTVKSRLHVALAALREHPAAREFFER